MDPAEHTRRLAAESLAAGDPTGWFQRLYSAAERGEAIVPWDHDEPHPHLVAWAAARELRGDGRRALVTGSGLGHDAELLAGLGFETTAFDVSAAAVAAARRRYPQSAVRYEVADLLDPPASWAGAFDLVVEIITVQALPDPPRAAAIARVGPLVAPGGTLLVISGAREAADGPVDGPPWPLTRAEVEAFAASARLRTVRIEDLGGRPRYWRAEFAAP